MSAAGVRAATSRCAEGQSSRSRSTSWIRSPSAARTSPPAATARTRARDMRLGDVPVVPVRRPCAPRSSSPASSRHRPSATIGPGTAIRPRRRASDAADAGKAVCGITARSIGSTAWCRRYARRRRASSASSLSRSWSATTATRSTSLRPGRSSPVAVRALPVDRDHVAVARERSHHRAGHGLVVGAHGRRRESPGRVRDGPPEKSAHTHRRHDKRRDCRTCARSSLPIGARRPDGPSRPRDRAATPPTTSRSTSCTGRPVPGAERAPAHAPCARAAARMSSSPTTAIRVSCARAVPRRARRSGRGRDRRRRRRRPAGTGGLTPARA